jgi:hypothetical protein
VTKKIPTIFKEQLPSDLEVSRNFKENLENAVESNIYNSLKLKGKLTGGEGRSSFNNFQDSMNAHCVHSFHYISHYFTGLRGEKAMYSSWKKQQQNFREDRVRKMYFKN